LKAYIFPTDEQYIHVRGRSRVDGRYGHWLLLNDKEITPRLKRPYEFAILEKAGVSF
jgi:hypothetical protein